MSFHLLGPMRIGTVAPSSAKLRTVISTLLMRGNEVVPAEKLIDEVWAEHPPRTATTTLQVYISQSRKFLVESGCVPGAGTDGRIVTQRPGYLINVAPGEFDIARFENRYQAGKAAAERGDFASASQLLAESLALWDGPILSDVPRGKILETAAARLEEMRLDATERRVHADLRLGRHHLLIDELISLVREHPIREKLHAHLMVALYRSDRQADALRVFQRIRQSLVDELGTEPCSLLNSLHRRILNQDPTLHLRVPSQQRQVPEPVPPWGGSPPVRLPHPVAHFTGRGQELTEAEHILGADSPRLPTRALFLSGGPGVGKSTTATKLAHRLADRYPDGRILVELRRPGDRRPLTERETLVRVLRLLLPGSAEKFDTDGTDTDELAERLRSAVSGRRMLLILDDVTSASQVRSLLSASEHIDVVLTGREAAVCPAGAASVSLGPLEPDDAALLLEASSGLPSIPAQWSTEIARLCDQHPLALRAAGAWLAMGAHRSAESLAVRLRDERTRLDTLRVGDLDVRDSLLSAYRCCSPEEQRTFRLLSLAPEPDFPLWAAAALLERDPESTERILERLVQIGLLRPRAPQGRPIRYGLGPLLRPLAAELLALQPGGSAAAKHRLLQHYLRFARHADRLLAPCRSLPEDEEDTVRAVPTEVVGTAPLRWFQEEASGLTAVLRQAHAAGMWRPAWQLAQSLLEYFQAAGSLSEWHSANELALNAARRAEDPLGEAVILYSQGRLAWQRRLVDHAADCYGLARERARAAHAPPIERKSTIGTADVYFDLGRNDAARELYLQVISVARVANDTRNLADALRGLALTELRGGDYESAKDHFTECRQLALSLGDRRWGEFARRSLFRLSPGAGLETAKTCVPPGPAQLELRPGVWLLEDVPTGAPQ